LQRKQPPVFTLADSFESRDSIASSPFPRNHSPLVDIIPGHETEHQNVEDLQQLELRVNAEFQHLDNSIKVAVEEKHIEDIIPISSQ
jgi:hypothetical protein